MKVSARNSIYWLHKLNAEEEEIVYEHERYHLIIGWGSKRRLLPVDPKKYTHGKSSYDVFPAIELPGNDWKWISPWKLDLSGHVDKDGWSYGITFTTMRLGHCYDTMRKKAPTRRRKWIRVRSRVEDSSLKNSIDDTHLDSVAGFLNKLGHRRKNWKRRYFELTGSILRYYVDHNSKWKGEVLLFHPAAKVHYVDIRESGRENTFSIDADDYRLLLQAKSPQDREDWIYALENAILCRDSYAQDEQAKLRREQVARRRFISSDVFQLHPFEKNNIEHANEKSMEIVERIKGNIEDKQCKALVHSIQTRYGQKNFQEKSLTDQAQLIFTMYRKGLDKMLHELLDQFDPAEMENEVNKIDHTMILLRENVVQELERRVFNNVQEIFYALLNNTVSLEHCETFKQKHSILSTKDQSFFDIDEKHRSPSNWAASIQVLNSIEEYSLPYEKTSVLVQVARTIAQTYQEEHRTSTFVLGADDFLPIFVYVLANGNVEHLCLTRDLLCATMLEAISFGEKGYYITMLEAAIEYMISFESTDS